MTEPIQSGISNPEAVETATAIGVSNVIVPTEVPIAVDTKQATIKRTATAYRAGINPSIKYATLSALLLPTTPTKVPAVKKIKSCQKGNDNRNVIKSHWDIHDILKENSQTKI